MVKPTVAAFLLSGSVLNTLVLKFDALWWVFCCCSLEFYWFVRGQKKKCKFTMDMLFCLCVCIRDAIKKKQDCKRTRRVQIIRKPEHKMTDRRCRVHSPLFPCNISKPFLMSSSFIVFLFALQSTEHHSVTGHQTLPQPPTIFSNWGSHSSSTFFKGL